MSSRADLPVVVFDGDDTLWETEVLYDDARSKAAHIVAKAGLDGEVWERRERVIDTLNARRAGLHSWRFPLSCVEALEVTAAGHPEAERSIGLLTHEVWSAASGVFSARARMMPHAADVLRQLRPTHRLALLTQGDPTIQQLRIDHSGLRDFFDEIEIVRRKDTNVLKQLLDRLGAPVETACMVGNSVPSDIAPALELGMRAIWIDAHVWEHERREALPPGHRAQVSTALAEVPALVANP
jgi:putative hydrolase of the HAD superfamily